MRKARRLQSLLAGARVLEH